MVPRGVVSRFLAAALAPLARIAMRFGLSARDFCDIVRWVYVTVFHSTPQFWTNRRPTVVQCAIKTGLSRLHVKALQTVANPQQALFTQRQNLAYRVIEGWVNDPDFHDEDGKPADLPVVEGAPGPTFADLFMKYGNDVPMTSVLGDLQHVGCVVVEEGVARLVNQTYGINFFDEDKLAIAAYMMRRLGETTDHNLTNPEIKDRRLQRFWFQTRVPTEQIEEAKRILHARCVEVGRDLDRFLSGYSHSDREPDREYADIGIAMYIYVDADPADEDREKHRLAERSDIE
jgi:hypothetical protein